MGLKADLESEVAEIFRTVWTERDGQVVPNDDAIKMGNDGVNLDATVLYADISDSTKLVDHYKKPFAAEIYKAFLRCAAKLIRSENGTITAYDGDRVMAVFTGDSKNSSAARCGLKINWAAKKIVQPECEKQYSSTDYALKHVVGIDTSKLLVARAGIRGANDLVWIGRAANYAAKLCTLSDEYPTWITGEVYDKLNKEAKYSNGTDMWEERRWNSMNNLRIYRSTFWWWLPD